MTDPVVNAPPGYHFPVARDKMPAAANKTSVKAQNTSELKIDPSRSYATPPKEDTTKGVGAVRAILAARPKK